MADPAGPRGVHAEHRGAGRRAVLVHGFTQTGQCWGPLATDLAGDHELVLVDAPGHGRSSAVDVDLWEGADLIVGAGGPDPAVYLGYSMGGRYCLHAALARPEAVRALVLVGATAGIADPEARATRRRADAVLAERLERDGVERFLDDWLALPLFDGLPEEAQFREHREANTGHGLAQSLRRAGTGAQEPLWHRLAALEMPVLVTAGARDLKFAAEAARLGTAIGPNATVVLVPDAGHAAHLENPTAFLAILRRWLVDAR